MTSGASATRSSNFEETEQSKIFPNEAFGYWKSCSREAPETGGDRPGEGL